MAITPQPAEKGGRYVVAREIVQLERFPVGLNRKAL
jgi:hypothetical protein